MSWPIAFAVLGLLLLPVAAISQEREAIVADGERLFKVQGCYGCHTVGRFGTPIGPDLSRVGGKYPKAYLTRWLSDPAAQRPNSHMPKLELAPAEIEALAAYLATLQ